MLWATSFFKRTWKFSDYPLDYIDQGECSPDLPERRQFKRWRLDLTNWYEMSGLGDSREAALADARGKFSARIAAGEKLCRPGTGPGSTPFGKPKITFPENQKIDEYPEFRDDFIAEILGLSWAWVTDESSLWDFHSKRDNGEEFCKIGEVYGVDVSHITDAKLVDILFDIMSKIHSFPEDSTHKAIRLERDARDRYNMGLPEEPWNPYC
jgi:hypothetical protein